LIGVIATLTDTNTLDTLELSDQQNYAAVVAFQEYMRIEEL